MEWSQTAFYTLSAAGGLFIGYSFSMRHARRVKRRAVQQMNKQSLDLLDAKATISELQAHAATQSQKENLLKLTLTRLQKANQTISQLQKKHAAENKKHFIELSRMRMRVVEAREIAEKATAIARVATDNLKRLKEPPQATHTADTPEPKPYISNEPVAVSMVNQTSKAAPADNVTRVSDRASAHLPTLRKRSKANAS